MVGEAGIGAWAVTEPSGRGLRLRLRLRLAGASGDLSEPARMVPAGRGVGIMGAPPGLPTAGEVGADAAGAGTSSCSCFGSLEVEGVDGVEEVGGLGAS